LDRFSDSYHGYWIDATRTEKWVVRIRATIADLPPPKIASVVMPGTFTSLQVFENARSLINETLRIGEFAPDAEPTPSEDHA
jgi:hypothetical protein